MFLVIHYDGEEKFIYIELRRACATEPGGARRIGTKQLPRRKCWRRAFTFVLQRVAGPYLHSPAYWLSRTVNDLVVGKSDIKFLKLSHGSSPLRCYAATPRLWKREEALLRSHLLTRAPLETSDVTLTKTHWELMGGNICQKHSSLWLGSGNLSYQVLQ